MQFLVLICLMAACLPVEWPEPPFGTGLVGGIAITGGMVAIFLIVAWRIACWAIRRLNGQAAGIEEIDQSYGTSRTYFFFAYLLGFLVGSTCLGWGWTARTVATIQLDERSMFAPGGELLVLLPFFVIQIGSWCFFYGADRRYHELHHGDRSANRFWGRAGYVLFLIRQQALFIYLPLTLMMAAQGLERLAPEFFQTPWAPIAALLAVPAFFIFVPLIVPTVLGLKPLPPGQTLDQIEAVSRRLRFRYSRIYQWNTRGQVANAAVIGVLPWIRYVLFTDRLLDSLNESELDAVLGHEIGHAKHFHLPFYALFMLLSTVLIGLIVEIVRLENEVRWNEHRALFQVVPLALAGGYMFGVFGIVSRRCERQADVFGCRAGSCGTFRCGGHDAATVLSDGGRGLCASGIRSFVRAMKAVKKINGMKRSRPRFRGVGLKGKLHWCFRLMTGWLDTWLHSSIGKRIAFLQRMAKDPEIERRFQFRVLALKWFIVLSLSGAIAGIAVWKGWDFFLTAL
jgi:STE24 endopeptidase